MAAGVPTQLGHVALRVRDVDRAAEFYSDVLGLQLKNRAGPIAFLGIRPDASHEIALFPLAADAPGPDPERVGLYHMALLPGRYQFSPAERATGEPVAVEGGGS